EDPHVLVDRVDEYLRPTLALGASDAQLTRDLHRDRHELEEQKGDDDDREERRELARRLRDLADVECHPREGAGEPRENEEQERVEAGAGEAVQRPHRLGALPAASRRKEKHSVAIVSVTSPPSRAARVAISNRMNEGPWTPRRRAMIA